MNSIDLYKRSLKVAPGGVHSPVRAFKSVGGEPMFFKAAEGAYIESIEGVQYIDFCQSFGPNILGHRDKDVSVVVNEMVQTAWSLGACEPYSLELSEWMVSKLSFIDKVRFVCSGTEAVMSALRLARAATGREKIVKFNGCYHGHVDSMLVKAGSGLAGESASDSAGVPGFVSEQTLVGDLDDPKGLEEIFKTHGSEIAAVIVEPLPANFGLLKQREEFIKTIFDLAKSNGALVIFDEVISGFRVGLGGMAEKLGVEPDLITYGKIIGGGFPVGCYAGKNKIMDLVAPVGPVYQAGTLAANPIGMCAGLATLKKIESEDVYRKLSKRTDEFCKQLNDGFKNKDIPLQVINEGSLFWVYAKTDGEVRSVKDFVATHAENFNKMFHACLKRGIYLAPSGYEVGFVSYAHTEAILKEAAEKMIAAAVEIFN